MKHNAANRQYRGWSHAHKETVHRTPIVPPPYDKHPCRNCPLHDSTRCASCNAPELYDNQLRSDGRPNTARDGSLADSAKERSRSVFSKSSRKSQG